MANNISDEVQRLKGLLLQAKPIWIDGIDFLAFNYGDESEQNPMGRSHSVISSASGSAIIDRRTGNWRFTEPHMPIRELSHFIRGFERAKVDLTFNDVKGEMENGG